MNKQNTFNKAKFAGLLNQAKGDRSINRYARETNVSAAHISRFLREMIDAPPTPDTIDKFSSKASNQISYMDMMIAAGYVLKEKKDYLEESEVSSSAAREPDPVLQQISPSEKLDQGIRAEKRLFQIILSHLYEVPFEWSMQKPDSSVSFPDMMIDIDDGGYKRWLLEFKASINPSEDFRVPPHPTYGMIAVHELMPTDKFTVVVDNEIAYESFSSRPPLSLRGNIYIMLVDPKQGAVVKEEQLCSYYEE